MQVCKNVMNLQQVSPSQRNRKVDKGWKPFNYKIYVRLTLDTKLLKWILMGPKFAHWNVAENGSHISFDREPNVYERGLYYCLSYF